jgi:hypothetical protein
VVAKLGLLPLAIAQAGSFIAQRQISFQRYLTRFDESFKTAAACGTPEWPRGRGARNATILTTWEISFESLSHSAKELLLLCGFLANGDIPDELFDLESDLRFDWMGEGKKASFTHLLPFLTLSRKRLACELAWADLLTFPGKAKSDR